MKRTAEEVIREITDFLNRVGGAHDWDDFISIRIDDERLNAIRIECADLPVRYPAGNCRQYCGDEGLKRLQEIVDHFGIG